MLCSGKNVYLMKQNQVYSNAEAESFYFYLVLKWLSESEVGISAQISANITAIIAVTQTPQAPRDMFICEPVKIERDAKGDKKREGVNFCT